jgi:hypothetical protein
MRRITYTFILFGILALADSCSTTTSNNIKMKDCELNDLEIQHMVIFNLPYQEGSVEARTFLEDGTRILTAIPVVQNFQAFKQVSKKNDFQYGFSMVFANQDDYDIYNKHPDHVTFVQERWLKEVTDFLEIDLNRHH